MSTNLEFKRADDTSKNSTKTWLLSHNKQLMKRDNDDTNMGIIYLALPNVTYYFITMLRSTIVVGVYRSVIEGIVSLFVDNSDGLAQLVVRPRARPCMFFFRYF